MKRIFNLAFLLLALYQTTAVSQAAEPLREFQSFFGLTGDVTSLAISHDDTMIAAGTKRDIFVYDNVKQFRKCFVRAKESWTTHMIFSPDDTWLIVGELNDPFLQIWDMSTVESMPPTKAAPHLVELPGPVSAFCWSADKATLYVAAQRKVLAIPLAFIADDSLDTAPEAFIVADLPLKHPIYSIAQVNDRLVLAGGGYNLAKAIEANDGGDSATATEGEVATLDVKTKQVLQQQVISGGGANCAVSADGSKVAFIGGLVTVSGARGDAEESRWPINWQLTSLQIWQKPEQADGEWTKSAQFGELYSEMQANDKLPMLFGNGAAATAKEAFPDHPGGASNQIPPIHAVGFSPAGTLAITSGQSPHVAVWNSQDNKDTFGSKVIAVPHEDPVSVLTWSSSGSLAVAFKSVVSYYKAPFGAK